MLQNVPSLLPISWVFVLDKFRALQLDTADHLLCPVVVTDQFLAKVTKRFPFRPLTSAHFSSGSVSVATETTFERSITTSPMEREAALRVRKTQVAL